MAELEMDRMNIQDIQVGSNSTFRQGHDFHGPVNFLPEERGKPRPRSTVPFRQDEDFVPRQVLNEIQSRCSKPAARVAIVGLGGVGKSQIAIEYSYRIRGRFPDIWVFWVYANSMTRFEEGYRKIAQVVQLPGLNDPKADVFEIVSDWLSEESNGQWTMILDSADNIDVFTSPSANRQTKSILDCLPKSPNGSILVTSRKTDTAVQIVEGQKNVLEVGPMEETLAVQLLKSKLPRVLKQTDFEKLISLAKNLDYIPLAMTQAAAYIYQRTPLVTVSEYLEMISKDDKHKSRLLNKNIRDGRRDEREHGIASYSIISTWQITFEHIRQTRESAAQLLSLMSFFDRQGIPIELLSQNNGSGGNKNDDSDQDSLSSATNLAELEDDIQLLRDYSLVAVVISDKKFEMHRLVQFATKSWLKERAELTYYEAKFIRTLDIRMPKVNPEKFKELDRIFPHTQMILNYIPTNRAIALKWVSVLDRAGHYAYLRGNIQTARAMSRLTLDFGKKDLDKDSPQTISYAINHAVSLEAEGEFAEAENLFRWALEKRENTLGREHQKTLDALNRLAHFLINRKHYAEAENLLRKALKVSERTFGQGHPRVLRSSSRLARVLGLRGNYKEAIYLFKISIDGMAKHFGVEHPATLLSMNSLAITLQNLGKPGIAETIYKRILEITEKTLGEDHPLTIEVFGNLAASSSDQRHAEKLHRRVLESKEKILGKDHQSTLITAINLTSTLVKRGKDRTEAEKLETEELARRVFKTQEKMFGEEHPETLIGADILASVLSDQGDFTEALRLARRALEGFEKKLGKTHLQTLASVSNLASIFQRHGNYVEAEKFFRQLFEGFEEAFGVQHQDVSAMGHVPSAAAQQRNDYAEAEILLRAILREQVEALGREHRHPQMIRNALARLLKMKSRHEEAEELLQPISIGQ